MKVPAKILLILSLMFFVILTGCKQPPTTNTGTNNQAPVIEEKASNDQQTAQTAPSFSLTDLNTGKSIHIPSDIKGSKTALVFFSLT